MVQSIVSLGAELEAHMLTNGKGFEQPQVVVLEPGVVDHVANTGLMIEGAFGGRAPLQRATGPHGVAIGLVERIDPPVGVGVAAVVSHGLLVIEAAVVEDPILADTACQAAIDTNARVVCAAADASRS